MMEKMYETPTLMIYKYDMADVIRTSGENDDNELDPMPVSF